MWCTHFAQCFWRMKEQINDTIEQTFTVAIDDTFAREKCCYTYGLDWLFRCCIWLLLSEVTVLILYAHGFCSNNQLLEGKNCRQGSDFWMPFWLYSIQVHVFKECRNSIMFNKLMVQNPVNESNICCFKSSRKDMIFGGINPQLIERDGHHHMHATNTYLEVRFHAREKKRNGAVPSFP